MLMKLQFSKSELVLYLGLSIALTAGFGWVALQGSGSYPLDVAFWIIEGFMAACCAFFVLTLMPGSYLRVAPEGFAERIYPFHEWTFRRWDEVSRFEVGRHLHSRRRVVFNLSNFAQTTAKPGPLKRFFLKLYGGHQGVLLNCRRMSAAELAALLNQWRDRALSKKSPAPV